MENPRNNDKLNIWEQTQPARPENLEVLGSELEIEKFNSGAKSGWIEKFEKTSKSSQPRRKSYGDGQEDWPKPGACWEIGNWLGEEDLSLSLISLGGGGRIQNMLCEHLLAPRSKARAYICF